ncbi:MAG: monovalent cation/H+ antiporter complex subunit F [Desulfobacterales bacterium]|nr:monovalent cation/H+ antiporter complex subunit F [Desulfobacterales bacterium]
MNTFFLAVAMGLCCLMCASLYRCLFGPTVLDRLVGVNAIGTKTVVLLLLIGFLYERVDMFVDIALAYAFLNFVTVIAASRYFHKRKGLYEESFTE